MLPSLDTADLLAALRDGDQDALDRLVPRVYAELRRIAHRELTRRGRIGSLRTTELVHEAYMKLVGQTRVDVTDRAHFLTLAAKVMRHVVIDYARKRQALKRGGGWERISLERAPLTSDDRLGDLLDLDDALKRLEHFDNRMHDVVECRYFGGMTVQETAVALNVAPRTVDRTWQRAKAWLYREIHET